MRLFHILSMLCAALLLPLGDAWAQSPAFSGDGPPNIAASLQAESMVPAPGRTVTLAFVMTPRPGWHGYWENPGDAGIGMSVRWELPPGVTAGPLRHPVPETLLISGLMNYVYEGRYAILTTLTLPPSLKVGDRLPIRAKGSWLACTDQVCVPGGGDMALDLTVGDGAVTQASRAAFDGFRARLPRPLGAEGRYAVEGGRIRLAVPFPAEATSADPYFFPLTEGAVRYAEPQRVTRQGDWMIVDTAPGDALPPTLSGVIRTADHQGFVVTARPGAVPAVEQGSLAATVLLALGGALLGGVLLNIMPCVFPILSLKALSLARAGGDAGATRREAVAYALGVMLTCLALGGMLLALRAGGSVAGWAFQLQDPRIILILLLLVTAIALNLAGLFELRAIGAGGTLAGKGGVQGSFWTGALVAFVATPCTGPFMGAALGAALVLPAAAALAIFVGLGLGLALPFLLIAFVPAIRRRLPRPGPWMARFQRILSVPMALTALALLWLLGRQVGTDGMMIGIGAVAATALLLWLLGARQRTGRGGAPVLGALAVLLMVGAALLLPPPGTGAAFAGKAAGTRFSEAKLAQLRTDKKPVFLYFTADWCLTCKANEAAAIDRDEVTDAFRKAGVTVMVGDWTNSDPAIGRFLNRHGRSGVPLYLYYAPSAEPRVLPQLLTPATLTALVG